MLQSRSYRRALRMVTLAAGDVLLAAICVLLAVALDRADVLTPALPSGATSPPPLTRIALFAGSLLLALSASGFYTVTSSPRHRPSIAVALVLQIAIVGAASALLALPVSRTTLLIVLLGESLLLLPWRRVLAVLWPMRSHSVTVIGCAAGVARILGEETALRRSRIVVEAAITTDVALDIPAFAGMFGDDLAKRVIADAEEVIDVSLAADEARRLELIALRGPRGFSFVPSHRDALLAATDFSSIGDLVVAEVTMRGAYGGGAVIKRAFDLLVASALLIAAIPVLLPAMIAILVTSGRPVLLRQERMGKGGRPFRMLKLRTMTGAAGFEPVREGDARLTRVGRVLRRYRLDELPQLFNVLEGDMSLVGPRPEIPELTSEIMTELPSFPLRLHGLPGIAGLAQVSAEYDQTPETKLAFDLQYLCNWSVWQDVRILGRAVTTALAGRGL